MRYHTEDPPREKYQSIEKSPEDYYPIYSPELIYHPPKKETAHEKSPSKEAKKRTKKVHSRAKQPAVASIQKEL